MSEEPHVITALTDLCQKMQIKCLVQVGAHDGAEAAAIQEATGCRAIAIDGDPHCAPVNRKTIEWHELIIGATNCTVDFYVIPGSGLSSQIKRGDEMVMQLPQQRLDTFCSENGLLPDALIIDTEGTTMDVLQGCGGLLGKVRFIYAEVQTEVIREGISHLLPDVDRFLVEKEFVQREGLPAYDAGGQGNFVWWKP